MLCGGSVRRRSPVGTPNHAAQPGPLPDADAVARGGGSAAASARRAFDAGLGACPDVVAPARRRRWQARKAGGVLADVMANAIAAYLVLGVGQGTRRHNGRASGPGSGCGDGDGGDARARGRDRRAPHTGRCADLKALSAAPDRAPHALPSSPLRRAPRVLQPGEVAAGARGGERRAIRCGVPAIPARARDRRRRRADARRAQARRGDDGHLLQDAARGRGRLPPTSPGAPGRASRRRRARTRRPPRRREPRRRAGRCRRRRRWRRRRGRARRFFPGGRRGGGQRQFPAALFRDAERV